MPYFLRHLRLFELVRGSRGMFEAGQDYILLGKCLISKSIFKHGFVCFIIHYGKILEVKNYALLKFILNRLCPVSLRSDIRASSGRLFCRLPLPG